MSEYLLDQLSAHISFLPLDFQVLVMSDWVTVINHNLPQLWSIDS